MRRKHQVQLLPQRGRRAGPVDELDGGIGGGRSRDPNPPALVHPDIRPRFFRGAGRLEPPPFERDRRPLEATPQRIGADVAAPGELHELRDHAAPTSPPTSASSMRTCGAPSVTGRGNCPALPHPPPIWFQRKSAAIWSMRSSVWNRFPASTTSFTSSATRPSRIMRP